MPPTRRVKVFAIALTIITCTVLYLSRDSSSQEFYSRTVTALDKKEASDRDAHNLPPVQKDAAKGQQPLGAIIPQRPMVDDSYSNNIGELGSATAGDSSEAGTDTMGDTEKSVAGRKTMKGGEVKDVHSGKESPKELSKPASEKKAQDGGTTSDDTTAESEEEHKIKTELNSILKKGPIIIFSKSYCPHSAKAKKILLEKYTIVPAPFVVELDTHPLGQGLQNALERSTGRRTVPNVLINGRSIGGGDDIQALDESGGLVEKVKGMAGKRIMEARLT